MARRRSMWAAMAGRVQGVWALAGAQVVLRRRLGLVVAVVVVAAGQVVVKGRSGRPRGRGRARARAGASTSSRVVALAVSGNSGESSYVFLVLSKCEVLKYTVDQCYGGSGLLHSCMSTMVLTVAVMIRPQSSMYSVD